MDPLKLLSSLVGLFELLVHGMCPLPKFSSLIFSYEYLRNVGLVSGVENACFVPDEAAEWMCCVAA